MAGGISIQVQGLAQLQKKMGKMSPELIENCDNGMSAFASEYVARVVAATPVDTGRLKGATTFKRIAVLHYEIVNDVHYAPYVEFGTVSYVSVPADLQSYAAQFKGQGIIKNGGMRPRPFFFHIPWAQSELQKTLAFEVKRTISK